MNQPNQDPPTSALAITSLVFSLLCMPIGFLLAIISLIRISSSKGMLGGKTIAIVALAMSLMWVPISGVLAAIAIPNFIKFQCRSMQSEAKTNLKRLYVAQEGHHGEFDSYASIEKIGFTALGASNRYRLEVVESSADGFVARANGIKDTVEGDVWTIDEKNQLVATTDVNR